MEVYVKLDNSAAVLSDLASNKSYIFAGNFGRFFDISTPGFTTIDSIWEDDIYNRIHPDDLLTSRGKEILILINQGVISKEIAVKLNISSNTVNRHRQNILEKLNVNNSIEAVSNSFGFVVIKSFRMFLCFLSNLLYQSYC